MQVTIRWCSVESTRGLGEPGCLYSLGCRFKIVHGLHPRCTHCDELSNETIDIGPTGSMQVHNGINVATDNVLYPSCIHIHALIFQILLQN
ncbi:hypothetical protein TNIN_128551 [Trichonephila inaurata madagascariensis]|uniref:Uncharacterized protein n=1 Tax=Trichonephila inaurata madagascariensis TaxID=2747483 RepID=A0A8X6X6A3_9ARAC|nr:hypothetical protein TNIN_128551 [Trichonephila inaurata madagascariensis]